MTENTNQIPSVTAGYGPKAASSKDSLAYGEPARTPGDVETAAAGDAGGCSARCCNPGLNPSPPSLTSLPLCRRILRRRGTGCDPSSRLPGNLRRAPQATAAPQAPTAANLLIRSPWARSATSAGISQQTFYRHFEQVRHP